jgi:RNA polymerase sigma-70 factor (ECF subfamily)
MDYQVLTIEQLIEECIKRPCTEARGELIRRVQPVIAKVALRACHDWSVTAPDVIEDRVQDVFAKIFADDYALLRRFKSRHENAFYGYIKVVTVNLVYDYFRKIKPIDEKTEPLDDAFAQAQKVRDRDSVENQIFFKQVDAILRQRGNGPEQEKERAIFWLYYRHGMTAKEIASIPDMMTVKGVESCIFRLTAYVKQCVLKEKAANKQTGIPATEPF